MRNAKRLDVIQSVARPPLANSSHGHLPVAGSSLARAAEAGPAAPSPLPPPLPPKVRPNRPPIRHKNHRHRHRRISPSKVLYRNLNIPVQYIRTALPSLTDTLLLLLTPIPILPKMESVKSRQTLLTRSGAWPRGTSKIICETTTILAEKSVYGITLQASHKVSS